MPRFLLALVFSLLLVDGASAWSSPATRIEIRSSTTFTARPLTFKRPPSTHLFQSSKTDVATTDNEAEVVSADPVLVENVQTGDDNAYVTFAKNNPFANNLLIATGKTAAADLFAQTAIAHKSLAEVDIQQSTLFCLFGCVYLGAFQYLYQVQVFKRLFDVDKFTSQSLQDKLQDIPGLKALGAQTGLDLTVLTLVYLPTFYVFKAGVFSGSMDPSVWFSTGIDNFTTNFSKDEADLLKVWLPADLSGMW
ncbi:MAG: hypothetical protein SGARI_005552 [Bacillariaceae sp.]